MEWLTKDSVNLTIGGGNRSGDAYLMNADTDEILIKNIVFYDEMLSDDQIQVLAEHPDYYSNRYPYIGDANADNKVTARDALAVLKHAAKILELEYTEYVDVNADGTVNAEDSLSILKYVANLTGTF